MRPKKFCPQQCLSKAVEVFTRQGYDGTSFSDLTAALGVNRQSLYDTYGDKHQLYLKCIEVASDDFGPRRQLDNRERTGRQSVEAFFEEVLSKTESCLLTNALLERACHDGEVASLVKRCSALTLEALAACVQRGVDDGSISSRCQSSSTALALFNLLAGLRVSQKAGLSLPELRQVLRVSLRMLD